MPTTYLLDTNHISPLVTPGHPLIKRIRASVARGGRFAIAVLALTELLFGISIAPKSKQNLLLWSEVKGQFDYYDIRLTDAERAAVLQLELRRQGWQLGTIDALIAAIALRYDLTLLTTDRDFQAIPGLPQEN
ncbi:MAG: type II toxin-antitoxin system VapC family toxin [Candidatus Promineifilaceae bacterium]